MKIIKILMVVITGLMIFSSCENDEKKDFIYGNKEACTKADKEQTTKNVIGSLFNYTDLNYVVNDNCNYQPVHIQLRDNNPTTIIAARFTGKNNATDYILTNIEFLAFDVSCKENKQLGVKLIESKLDIMNKKLLIKLKLCKKGSIDCVNSIKFPSTSLKGITYIDFDVKYDKYPECNTHSITFGRHCGGNVIFAK